MRYHIQGRKIAESLTNDKAALNVILHDYAKTWDESRLD